MVVLIILEIVKEMLDIMIFIYGQGRSKNRGSMSVILLNSKSRGKSHGYLINFIWSVICFIYSI